MHEGNAYLAPMDAIDPDTVELADVNPENDLTPEKAKSIHTPEHNDEWVAF